MLDSGGGLDPFGRRLRRQRQGRLRRGLPSISCVAGAIVLMALIGDADTDQGNLWAIPALGLVWTAVTLPAWRAGGTRNGSAGQAGRLRRLHRRLHLRVAILLTYASLTLWWLASYAHFEGSDEYGTTNPTRDSAHFSSYAVLSLWLLAGAAVVFLVESVTWRLWPTPIRMAAREEQLAAKDARRSARVPGYPLR